MTQTRGPILASFLDAKNHFASIIATKTGTQPVAVTGVRVTGLPGVGMHSMVEESATEASLPRHWLHILSTTQYFNVQELFARARANNGPAVVVVADDNVMLRLYRQEANVVQSRTKLYQELSGPRAALNRNLIVVLIGAENQHDFELVELFQHHIHVAPPWYLRGSEFNGDLDKRYFAETTPPSEAEQRAEMMRWATV